VVVVQRPDTLTDHKRQLRRGTLLSARALATNCYLFIFFLLASSFFLLPPSPPPATASLGSGGLRRHHP
jgi:hypothetical protein